MYESGIDGQLGIFSQTGSIQVTTNDIEVTGSKIKYFINWFYCYFTNNIQNGYPTSNNWGENLEGSYFNNFDNTTHVSEILRFITKGNKSFYRHFFSGTNTKGLG